MARKIFSTLCCTWMFYSSCLRFNSLSFHCPSVLYSSIILVENVQFALLFMKLASISRSVWRLSDRLAGWLAGWSAHMVAILSFTWRDSYSLSNINVFLLLIIAITFETSILIFSWFVPPKSIFIFCYRPQNNYARCQHLSSCTL